MAVCKVLGLPIELCTMPYPGEDLEELETFLSPEIFRRSHDT